MALDHNALAVQGVHPRPRQTTRLEKERLPHCHRLYEFWVVHSQFTQHPPPKCILDPTCGSVQPRNGTLDIFRVAMAIEDAPNVRIDRSLPTLRVEDQENEHGDASRDYEE